MTQEVEFVAMITDHIDWKRRIRQHVSQDDEDGEQRAGEVEIIQRCDPVDEAESQRKAQMAMYGVRCWG